jgi:hypothetical protein
MKDSFRRRCQLASVYQERLIGKVPDRHGRGNEKANPPLRSRPPAEGGPEKASRRSGAILPLRWLGSKKQIICDRRPFTHDDENLARRAWKKRSQSGERTAKTRLAPSDFRKKPNRRGPAALGPRLTGLEKTNHL